MCHCQINTLGAMVLCCVLAFIGCHQSSPPADSARDPRLHSILVDESPPQWTHVLNAQPMGLAGPLVGIKPGMDKASLNEIAPELSRGRSWAMADQGGVVARLEFDRTGQTVRFVYLTLPPDSLSVLRRLWGQTKTGHIDGRRRGDFWFDANTNLQVIAERRTKDVRLTLNRYVAFEVLFASPPQMKNGALASLIGVKSRIVRRRAHRIIRRKSVDGFIGFFNAPQYGTRHLKCKIELRDDRVFRLQFKVDTLGWPQREKMLESLITRAWGAPRTSSTGTLHWRKHDIELRMETRRPEPTRPPEPTLHFTLTQASDVVLQDSVNRDL